MQILNRSLEAAKWAQMFTMFTMSTMYLYCNECMGSEFRSIVQPTAKELQFEEIIWHNFEEWNDRQGIICLIKGYIKLYGFL